MSAWGLDLGTTNSAIARWNSLDRRPELVELRAICRKPDARKEEELGAARMVPSCVHARPLGWKERLGRMRLVQHFGFLGDEADIGRPAQSANEPWPQAAYCPTFKSALGRDPHLPVAMIEGTVVTARAATRLFLRELLDEVQQHHGERIRELVVATPIEAFEQYRAEVRQILDDLGVTRVHFVDEPVAAALGYGVGLDRAREIVVIDIGGGTMHAARVELRPRGVDEGACTVIAKEGHAVGGNLVDRWLLELAASRAGLNLEGTGDTHQLWLRAMMAEARRVKESLHTQASATFTFTAPEELTGLRGRVRGVMSPQLTPTDLEEMLVDRGFFTALEGAMDRVGEGEEVLVVGGSSLLPGVFRRIEARYGRDRVRAWQPFEAVALGASVFAGGDMRHSDFIIHDYALVTHSRGSGDAQHIVIVPRGTPVPSKPDLWRRQLVPTCSLGEPERIFRLSIVEMARNLDGGVRFGWDASGTLQPMAKDGAAPLIVALNEANPTLGTLDPPHPPNDPAPRLDVSFAVNEDRWLVATVRDLKTQRILMNQEAVVRLL